MNELSMNLVADAKVFADNYIRPFAAQFDEQQAIPMDLVNNMAEKGYLGATFPEIYGGLALDPVTYGLLTEEIGKACASTRSLLTVHTSLVGETILKWGNKQQRSHWLPAMARGEKIGSFALSEPETGSDARSIKTAYRQKGDEYIINGRKKWISFSAIADFFIVIAGNEGTVSAFIVEKDFPGVTITPMKGLLGNRAAYLAEIDFQDVIVPGENLLGMEGGGFTYIVNTALDHGRYSIAWAGLALAQEALDAMVAYSMQRQQFGNKIFQYQSVQAMIAEAAANIQAARALCLNVGRLRTECHVDAVTETIIAKYFTSRMAMKVTTDAVQVHGGNGCHNKYPVERLFREAKILEIIEGTSQMHQEIIAMHSAGKYAKNARPVLTSPKKIV